MTKFNQSRRRFLTQSGVGLVTLTTLPRFADAMESMRMGGGMGMGMHSGSGEIAYPKLSPNKANPHFHPDVELDLVCKPAEISILKIKRILHMSMGLNKVSNIPYCSIG